MVCMSFCKDTQVNQCFDCIVIGGGAAGMMAAITAARCGANVAILEHTSKLGSKILQTGNGKCNFTNYDMSADKFRGGSKEIIDSVLDAFRTGETIGFFKSIGVLHKERAGYVYPHSETAASLVEALKYELYRLGVHTFAENDVKSVSYHDYVWGVTTDKGEYRSKTVVLATGSKAAPKTGSDGSGYKLAKSLGHTVKKPLPALVQLVSDNVYCKALAGVRSVGKVSVVLDDKLISEDMGEIQYTDYGISGIPVFQISRYAVDAVDKGLSAKVHIDMLPDMSLEEINSFIEQQSDGAKHKTIDDFFGGLLNKKLVNAVAKSIGVDGFTKVYKVSEDVLKNMAVAFKNFSFNIVGFKGFDNGQVCQGGVSLDEVLPQTLESKLNSGLFFAGELLDVDGMCGGYNLQWAWSSGYVAGINASKKALGRVKNGEDL